MKYVVKLSRNKKINRQIFLLRAKYLSFAISIFLAISSVLALYNYLDAKFKFSKIFEFKTHNDILDHDFIFPALNKNLFSGFLVFLGVIVGWIACYQVYHKYDYEHEKLTCKTLERKKISWISFLKALLFIVIYQIMFFIGDEIVFGLEEALNGPTNWLFFMLVGFVILFAVILNNLGDLKEKSRMNSMSLKAENKNDVLRDPNSDGSFFTKLKTKKKYYFYKFLSILVASIFMLLSAYIVGKLPEWISCLEKITELKITISCFGDNITLFNNENNIFFLMWVEFAAFLLLYKVLLPYVENKFDHDGKNKDNKQNSLNHSSENKIYSFFKSIAGTFIAAVVANLSLNVSNSLQSLSGNSVLPYIICIGFITFAGLILVGYNVHNFIDEKKELNLESITSGSPTVPLLEALA